MYKIYKLISTENLEAIRYIGATTRTLNQRLSGHKHCANNPKKRGLPVHKWMYSVYQKGYDIKIELIEECRDNIWEDREKYWIKYYREKGYKLMNLSDGGYGIVTAKQRTKNSIQRSAEAHKHSVYGIKSNTNQIVYKFNSINDATKQLKLNSKSAISNCIKGRSKTCQNCIWIYQKDYDLNKIYKVVDRNLKHIYEFDLGGNLIKEWRNISMFNKIKGYSQNGVKNALKNNTIYKEHYWSYNQTINIKEYEFPFKYKVLTNSKCKYFRKLKEVSNFIRHNYTNLSTRLIQGEKYINGFKIERI